METAVLDPLTGAYTRATLPRRLEEEFARAERTGQFVSILLIDLDYFKSINDAFGHAAGDAALQALVQRIRSIIRKSDLLFRYGGDEFLLLLPDTSARQAATLARRLEKKIRASPLEGTDPPISVTISGGSATFPTDGESIELLFAVADRRHYSAKQQGRARIVVNDTPLTDEERRIRPPSRFIGQERSVRKAQEFLLKLGQEGRALLQAEGTEENGIPRYMEHVERLARLHGYLVLHLRPTEALSHRAYGALQEGTTSNVNVSLASIPFLQDLRLWERMRSEKEAAGWLVLVDAWEHLDESSRSLLEYAFTHEEIATLGIAYGIPRPPLWRRGFPWEHTPRLETALPPLSVEDTLAWLRQAMHWNPQPAFAVWLHEAIAGKAGWLLPALETLLADGVLRPLRTSDWEVQPEYLHYPLAERLAKRMEPPPARLPALFPPLVGRHEEISAIKTALAKYRLVSLIAPGGTGKTRLATQVAAEMRQEFPDGVFFISLESIFQASLLPIQIAETLGLSLDASLLPSEALSAALADKRLLLVLDNFEQLAPTSHFLPCFLERTEGPRILLTSRIPLEMRDEYRIPLGGLRCPDAACEKIPQIFENVPAVRFFMDSVHTHHPEYRLKSKAYRAVRILCELTGGTPLGLQLAAAWIVSTRLEELVRQLQSNLSLLNQEGAGGTPRRQRSMRAVFDTVWTMLSPSEQVTLARLSVFPAAFSLQAARQIAEASPFFMDGLTRHAIFWRQSNRRYHCHPLLRTYLHERLQAFPETLSRSRERFVTYFAALADKTVQEWGHAQRDEIRHTLAIELNNLRKAWEWGLQANDFVRLLPLLKVLHYYFQHYGWLHEGLDTFQRALAVIRQQASSPEQQLALAHIQIVVSKYHYHLGWYAQGMPLAQEALHLLREHGSAPDIFHALENLGSLAQATGDQQLAQSVLQEQLLIAQSLGRSILAANVHSNFALTAYHAGRMDEAEQHFLQALEIFRAENLTTKIVAALNNLGNVAYERGHYEQARLYLQECLPMAEMLEGQTLLAAVLDSCAKTLVKLKQYARAEKYLLRGLEICREVDAIPLGLELLANFGALLAAQNALETARRLWEHIAIHPRAVHSVRRMALEALQSHGFPAPVPQTPTATFEDLLRLVEKRAAPSPKREMRVPH